MLQAVVSNADRSLRSLSHSVSSVNTGFASTDRKRPLVADLEAALLRRSLVAEGIAALLCENPLMAFVMLFWLIQGRSIFRSRILARAGIKMASLPVNDVFIAYARTEAARGREIVLTTTAPRRFAEAALRRFPFVSHVAACSNGEAGDAQTRAASLAKQFPGGFHYAGACEADIAVWQVADHIIIVDPVRRAARKVRLLGRAVTQLVSTPVQSVVASSKISHEERTIVSTGVAAGMLIVAFVLLVLVNTNTDPHTISGILARLAPLALVVCVVRAIMLFVMNRSGANPVTLTLRDRISLGLALLGGVALVVGILDATRQSIG